MYDMYGNPDIGVAWTKEDTFEQHINYICGTFLCWISLLKMEVGGISILQKITESFFYQQWPKILWFPMVPQVQRCCIFTPWETHEAHLPGMSTEVDRKR